MVAAGDDKLVVTAGGVAGPYAMALQGSSA